MGFFQSSLDQPVRRRIVEYRFEVSFKGGQTAPGKIGKPVDAHIEFIIFVHECFQVDFFRNAEIKKDTCESGLGLQQNDQQLLPFNIGKCLVDLAFCTWPGDFS